MTKVEINGKPYLLVALKNHDPCDHCVFAPVGTLCPDRDSTFGERGPLLCTSIDDGLLIADTPESIANYVALRLE
jgi:hypothetical protein